MDKLAQSTVQYCETLDDVRKHIDVLDEKIMALLAQRGGYVAQAARIKSHAAQIVDVPRIEYIVQRVRAMARAQGGSEAVAETTYRAMIGAFIAFERNEFERLGKGSL